MDRNYDILYEIILTLIAHPTPRGLYNLIATNPTAGILFQCYPQPLLKRVSELERAVLAHLHSAFATSDRAMAAARTAVKEARAVEGTSKEEELFTKAIGMSRAATQQQKEAREALDAAEPVLTGTATTFKAIEWSWVANREFEELCRQLAEWRRFRTKVIDAVMTAASAQGKNWNVVCDRVRKIAKKHGRDEFLKRWRRALCGLGIGARRSTRMTQRRTR
jgi:preprotein translocase subunit Sss1